MPDLLLEEVCFDHGGTFSLREIDLSVPAGSFLAVIGPNGSGKTTLLQLMSGHLLPRRGRIDLAGHPLNSLSRQDAARRIALISSNQNFDFPFPVREVVAMGRFPYLTRYRGMERQDHDIVEQALEKTGAMHLRNRPINRLSSGERQMVLVARALAQTPSILMLDEPNVHLDIQHQLRIFRLLRSLHKEYSMSVIVVLHDLTAAATFFQRIALLSDGRLIQTGPPDEVITASNIFEVYGVEVTVRPHPLTGKPHILYAD